MNVHHITHAIWEDEEWIRKIYSQAKKEIGSFNLYRSWDNYINKNTGVFLVIRPKAFVRYTFSKRKDVYVVQEIAVHKDFRGEGCAYELMNAVERPVMLKCNKGNMLGNEFYKKLGMQLIGETETRKGVPQNIYLCAASSDTSGRLKTLF